MRASWEGRRTVSYLQTKEVGSRGQKSNGLSRHQPTICCVSQGPASLALGVPDCRQAVGSFSPPCLWHYYFLPCSVCHWRFHTYIWNIILVENANQICTIDLWFLYRYYRIFKGYINSSMSGTLLILKADLSFYKRKKESPGKWAPCPSKL